MTSRTLWKTIRDDRRWPACCLLCLSDKSLQYFMTPQSPKVTKWLSEQTKMLCSLNLALGHMKSSGLHLRAPGQNFTDLRHVVSLPCLTSSRGSWGTGQKLSQLGIIINQEYFHCQLSLELKRALLDKEESWSGQRERNHGGKRTP